MRILPVIAVFLACAAPVTSQSAHPNFSGTWALNIEKSDFAPAQAPEFSILTIVHNEPQLTLLSRQKTSKVETTKTMVLNSNGKETPNVVQTSYGDMRTTSITKWDGKKLATTYDLPHVGSVDSFHDAWNLSEDGRILTILRRLEVTDLQGSKHQYLFRMVYDKK